MSRDTLIAKYDTLPAVAQKQVEAFLQGDKGAAWISDFMLHSIGVLLFRQKRLEVFDRFAADTLPQPARPVCLEVTESPRAGRRQQRLVLLRSWQTHTIRVGVAWGPAQRKSERNRRHDIERK
jgi:hypothetical protein